MPWFNSTLTLTHHVMSIKVLLIGTRSLAQGLATFSLVPCAPPRRVAKSRFKVLSPSEASARDREALAGDWRRVGEDIRNAADVVMAGKA